MAVWEEETPEVEPEEAGPEEEEPDEEEEAADMLLTWDVEES